MDNNWTLTCFFSMKQTSSELSASSVNSGSDLDKSRSEILKSRLSHSFSYWLSDSGSVLMYTSLLYFSSVSSDLFWLVSAFKSSSVFIRVLFRRACLRNVSFCFDKVIKFDIESNFSMHWLHMFWGNSSKDSI